MPSSTRTSIALWKWFSAPFDAMRITVQVRYDARATRGNSSKGVWTLFILVIMNYWGNTQGETANAKNQWGDADKLGNGHTSVYAYAAGPSPQQGMLLHLPSLRAGCLPFGRTMAYDIYAKTAIGMSNTQAECSFIKVGMQHTCRRSGKGVQIHRAKIQ